MSMPPDTPPAPPRASEITDSSELGPLIKQASAQDPGSDRCVTWTGRVDSYGFPEVCMRKSHLNIDPKSGFLSRSEFEKGPRPKLIPPPDVTEDTDEDRDGS